MELKVYVEGIQRVVCGVTDTTTCQDVVIALAHAIGRTGRFTLIEKWRNNERLLAPSEHPLKVLQKWGEYATDVIFILKYSEKEDGSEKRTDKFLHDFTPHNEARWSGRGSGRGLKKSLTFSGAHNLSPPKSSRQVRHPRRGLPNDSSLDSLDEHSSLSSYNSRSTSSPYASLENRHIRHRGNNTPCQQVAPFGSLDRHKRTQAVRPSQIVSPQSGSGGSATSSLERRPNRSHIHFQQHSYPLNIPPNSKGEFEEYDLDKHLPSSPLKGKVNGTEGLGERNSAEKEVLVGAGEREDVMKLVKLQQERLSVQESQIQVLNSEISFWEDRDKEQDSQIKMIKDEIETLSRRENDLGEELEELDLVSWVDKLEIEKQRQESLKSELSTLKSKMVDKETEIDGLKSRIESLQDDIMEEKKESVRRDRAEQQRDVQVLRDITVLHQEMNSALEAHREATQKLEEVQGEVRGLEEKLNQRKNAMADMDREMRATNFSLFMSSPAPVTDWSLKNSEDNTNFGIYSS